MEVLNNIIQFIKDYYQFIALGASLLLLILDLFILGLRNRSPLISVSNKLREWLPDAIKMAEATSMKGEEKLAFVVDIIKGYLEKSYPKINPDKYTKVIVDLVEELLTTPQKKGVKNG